MGKVYSYKEYKDELDGRGDVIVFRGQPVSDYVLIPSGLRPNHAPKADGQMFQFVDQIRDIFGFDELTCIEIAQHFNLPTRMLDFSYSFDVALFFACYDSRNRYDDCDGKVYIFNKSRYEQLLKDNNKLSSQVIKNNQVLYEWLQGYIDKKDNMSNKGLDMPIFVEATRQFDRLHIQKGLFLLWGEDECSFEEILKKEGLDYSYLIDEIVIDKEAKPQILEDLKQKHISVDTLYMNIARIKEIVYTIKYGRPYPPEF